MLIDINKMSMTVLYIIIIIINYVGPGAAAYLAPLHPTTK